jgi:tetratricopeptide (TPR) repeat protein
VGKASRKKRKGSINEGLGDDGRHVRESKPWQKSPLKAGLKETSSIITFIPILILMIISFAVYWNALSGDFVYDDALQIVNNPWITSIKNIPTIFSRSVWSFQGLSISNYYRPMMHIVYMLNYHLFGLKPWGFHLVNILFHCGASVLVFLIIRRFLIERQGTYSSVYLSPPFIAAILFAAHPIHTEAVSWIAGLPDVAFTFFYLLSLYIYILFREGAKRGYLLSVLSFSLATLFKEPALTLPVMLMAYDCLVKKPDETVLSGIKRYIPYAVVSGVYLLLRYNALRSFAPSESYSYLSTYQLIINVLPLFREYLTGLLWPFDLNVWHTFHPISSLFGTSGIISMLVAVLFFIGATAAYRKNKIILFSLLLVVVPLLPVFYIRAISGKPFAERYLYLPSVGFVLLLAVFLSWARGNLPRAVRGITLVFIVMGAVYAFATITRNNVWRDDFSLWSDAVRKSPDSVMAHYNLGVEYVSQKQLDRAISEFQTALRMNPNNAQTHYSLANAYSSQGLSDMAIAEYRSATRLKPDFAEAHNNLATEYESRGMLDNAVAEFQAALRLNPNYVECHDNLGAAYMAQGLPDKAAAEFQAALRLNPAYAKSHNNLGSAYASQGLLDMAIAEYQSATRLKPDLVEAHYNLGIAYSSKGRFDMAIEQYKIALGLKPDFYEARRHLNDIISRRR